MGLSMRSGQYSRIHPVSHVYPTNELWLVKERRNGSLPPFHPPPPSSQAGTPSSQRLPLPSAVTESRGYLYPSSRARTYLRSHPEGSTSQRPCGAEPDRSASTSPKSPAAVSYDHWDLLLPPLPPLPPRTPHPLSSTVLVPSGIPSGLLPPEVYRPRQRAVAPAASAGAAAPRGRSSPVGPAGACSPSIPPSTTSESLACE